MTSESSMSSDMPSDPAQHDSRIGATPSAILAWNSADIFRGSRTVEIVHEGERYRLLVTRNGKLILQK